MFGVGLTQSIFTIAGQIGGDLLYTLTVICAVGGFLGIAGGFLEKKLGGDLMVVGSVLALIGAGLLFGGFLGVLRAR